MGMTDSQFKSWVRFLLEALTDATQEDTEEIKKEKLARIMDNLQKTLED